MVLPYTAIGKIWSVGQSGPKYGKDSGVVSAVENWNLPGSKLLPWKPACWVQKYEKIG